MTATGPRIAACSRMEHSHVAVQSEHDLHCMVQFMFDPAPTAHARPALNLALVIDRSGSMAGAKLEATKESARFLVRRLTSEDRMALVTFDDTVAVPYAMGPVDLDSLLLAITEIHDGGSTNLSGGWLKGVEEVARTTGTGPRKVLLLSDGQANVGIDDRDVLATMARKAREAHGVSTTTIGFGEGFDEDLMSRMADAGTGSAHFIEGPDGAPAVFAEEFADLASIVAQNVSVEIRPTDEVAMLGILNEFPQVAVEGGVQVLVGDAYAGESRQVILHLHVPALPDLGPTTIADVVIRYVALGERIESHEIRLPLTVNVVGRDDDAVDEVDREVVDEVTVLRAAKAQAAALEALDRGDFDGARALLDHAAEALERTADGSPREASLRAQARSMRERTANLDPDRFGAMERKAMRYDERQMRSTRLGPDGRRKRR